MQPVSAARYNCLCNLTVSKENKCARIAGELVPNARPYHPMMRLGEAREAVGLRRRETRRLAFTAAQPSFVKHLGYAAQRRAPHWLDCPEFAHCEPNALAFRALVALLDTSPGDDQTPAIAYADKLLPRGPIPFDLPHGLGARA